jgi:hypothetical protein
MKIHVVGAELFHAGVRTDRWTNMTKLIIAFRNFANAPDNGSLGLMSLVAMGNSVALSGLYKDRR